MNIATLTTAGSGLWSRFSVNVKIIKLAVPYINEQQDFGELRVYFDPATWDVDKLGLIYTDPLWMEQLREWLSNQGYAGWDVDYSEQGMQGTDYVSCDVGQQFLQTWLNK